jgi:hypothetical protein
MQWPHRGPEQASSASYELLNLITYYRRRAGSTRLTVHRGESARSAGVIHS